jgi:hypothetical protein
VPDLLYVSAAWASSQKEIWLNTKPLDRLYRIASSLGWIDDEIPVLPFFFRENRLVPDAVTLLNGNHPYVVAPQQNASGNSEGGRAALHIQGSTQFDFATAASQLATSRVNGLEGVLDRLESIYHDDSHSGLTKFSIFASRVRTVGHC